MDPNNNSQNSFNPNQQNNPQMNYQPNNPRVVDSIQPPINQIGNIQPQSNNQQSNNIQPASLPTQTDSNLNSNEKTKKKPKFVLIFVIGLVLLGGMTLLAILLAPSGNNNQPTQNQQSSSTAEQNSEALLESAESIDVEQVKNSITQDFSSLNTENDYPVNQFDDKALGL